jgi:hypothetical protein
MAILLVLLLLFFRFSSHLTLNPTGKDWRRRNKREEDQP